jgi:acetyl-CoA C-acetyltransferase
MKTTVAVVGAMRTPIGKFLGAFSSLSAVDLGVVAAGAAIKGSGLAPEAIQEVIFGHARQAGAGPNPARQVGVGAGIPVTAPAMTINQACGSGLTAMLLARDRIRLGYASIVLAGGMESMTRVPYLLPRAREGYRLGHDRVVDAMYQDGFLCPLAGGLMGETAETLAGQYTIPREEQDAFAARSQNRAEAAIKEGRFDSQIVPVTVAGRKAEVTVERDEHPRSGVTAEALAKLPPVFAKTGTVTAGNSSGITDGAAALVLMSGEEVAKRGIQPLAWVEEGTTAGVEPRVMGIGPVPAVRALEQRNGRGVDAYDLIELNEAFAAQVIAVDRELKLPADRLNVNGGAIALGHPIGATGARIVVTLLHEMQRRQAACGLATLCVSGGLGVAASLLRDEPSH